MVSVELSHKRLNELVGKKLSLKFLEDTLVRMGFELDDAEGDNLKVDVTTERLDCISVHGLARALRAYLGFKSKHKEYKLIKSGYDFIIHDSLRKVRPYAVGCIIKDLKFTDKLIKDVIWVQEKIHATYGRDRRKAAIGIYPLKDIKSPVHFKAEVPDKIIFTPLGFSNALNARAILNQHPTGIKYAHLLSDFSKYPVLVDGVGNVLSMPPIINSEAFGKVTEDTHEIFIEVTGTDWLTVNKILTNLAVMFADEGGVICQVRTRYSNKSYMTPLLKSEKWLLSRAYVNKQLGTNFSSKEIIELLGRMGLGGKASGDKIEVFVPFYRTDILHAVDIIDDIARAYDFNNFKPELPRSATIGGLLPRTVFNNRLRELLVGHGLLEVFTRALTMPDDQFKRMNLQEVPHVSVMSPRCPESVLRVSLLPELIKCFESNLHGEFPQRIFEVNDVALIDESSDVKSVNETRLSVAVCNSNASFTEVKEILESVRANLGLDFELMPKDYGMFIKGRSAAVTVKGKEIGFIGELHPQVITNFGLKLPVAAFELILEGFY